VRRAGDVLLMDPIEPPPSEAVTGTLTPIPGYEGLYAITPTGAVWAYGRVNCRGQYNRSALAHFLPRRRGLPHRAFPRLPEQSDTPPRRPLARPNLPRQDVVGNAVLMAPRKLDHRNKSRRPT
jgi:hypothetical protein